MPSLKKPHPYFFWKKEEPHHPSLECTFDNPTAPQLVHMKCLHPALNCAYSTDDALPPLPLGIESEYGREVKLPAVMVLLTLDTLIWVTALGAMDTTVEGMDKAGEEDRLRAWTYDWGKYPSTPTEFFPLHQPSPSSHSSTSSSSCSSMSSSSAR